MSCCTACARTARVFALTLVRKRPTIACARRSARRAALRPRAKWSSRRIHRGATCPERLPPRTRCGAQAASLDERRVQVHVRRNGFLRGITRNQQILIECARRLFEIKRHNRSPLHSRRMLLPLYVLRAQIKRETVAKSLFENEKRYSSLPGSSVHRQGETDCMERLPLSKRLIRNIACRGSSTRGHAFRTAWKGRAGAPYERGSRLR